MNPIIMSFIYNSFTHLSQQSFHDIQKQIEKTLIQQIIAPMKLEEVRRLIMSYQQSIHKSALTTQHHVQALQNLVPVVAEGQWSKKIRQTIDDHQQTYDKI